MNRRKRQGWIRGAVMSAALVVSATAAGQPAPKAGGAAPAVSVDQLFEAGRAAMRRQDWKTAAEKFRQAYKIEALPQIAGNLGEAELRLGHFRDAAEHLDTFLRLDKGAPAADKALAKGWLEEARKKIVTLKIEVEGPGADVSIDGKPVGKSPLPPEAYVEPGKHTVEARLGDARAEATDTYQAGWTRVIKLVPKEAPATGPVGPVATSSATPTSTGVLGPAVPEKAGAGDSARTGVLIGGGVVALAGVGVGVAGLVLAGQKTAERDAYCEGVEDRCLTTQGEDPALYADEKKAWTAFDNDRRAFTDMGIAGLVVGGVAAVATGITYFLWKPSSSKAEAKQGIVIMPAGAGVVVRGNW